VSDVKDDKVAEAQASDQIDYIEFLGLEPYGTEFYKGEHGTHSIERKHMKDYHDIDLGKKEVVWRKGTNGRMLVPVTDLNDETVAYLVTDPMFKRVTL
jgi:hypothetical protein